MLKKVDSPNFDSVTIAETALDTVSQKCKLEKTMSQKVHIFASHYVCVEYVNIHTYIYNINLYIILYVCT